MIELYQRRRLDVMARSPGTTSHAFLMERLSADLWLSDELIGLGRALIEASDRRINASRT